MEYGKELKTQVIKKGVKHENLRENSTGKSKVNNTIGHLIVFSRSKD
jgi:hypothetical protein